MLKNWLIYLGLLAAAFVFSLYYFKWFSWIVLLIAAAAPIVSLLLSLPFMITAAAGGVNVSAPGSVSRGDGLSLGVSPLKRASVFPRLKLTLACENRFASQKLRLRFCHCGLLRSPLSLDASALSAHCGEVTVTRRRCFVYYMLGLFCLPVRINAPESLTVYPVAEEPALLPEAAMTVVGYKPKSGGGFADDYELRPYIEGDSPRSIHWKLSSRTDEPIVREPSLPVCRELPLMPVLGKNRTENDGVLARLYGAVRLVLTRTDAVCLDRQREAHRVNGDDGWKEYLRALYAQSGSAPAQTAGGLYRVTPSGEEVSGL